MPELDQVIEIAKKYSMTDVEREQQRQSFAYGNANIENEFVTREMISDAAKRLPENQGD